MTTWVRFSYRDFWDVPRMLIFRHLGATYLLDCPFDEGVEDYAPYFNVYRLSEVDAASRPSWADLPDRGYRLGQLPVNVLRLDPSRRRLVDIDFLGGL